MIKTHKLKKFFFLKNIFEKSIMIKFRSLFFEVEDSVISSLYMYWLVFRNISPTLICANVISLHVHFTWIQHHFELVLQHNVKIDIVVTPSSWSKKKNKITLYNLLWNQNIFKQTLTCLVFLQPFKGPTDETEGLACPCRALKYPNLSLL